MKNSTIFLSLVLLISLFVVGCGGSSQPSGVQIVLLGESNASGEAAVQQANLAVANAAGSGCNAISVGGYATGGEGLVFGVPVLVECPTGTQLLPNGSAAP